MKIVGITGGIGSGKTTACEIFKLLGVKSYNSDIEAKRIIEDNEDLKIEIIKYFGKNSYNNNRYNTKYISSIVFNNTEELNKLNSIVHPYVERDFLDWTTKQVSSKYVLKESAILFESGAYRSTHENIAVIASKEVRIKRVMKRNSLSRKEVEKIIEKQLSNNDLISMADYHLDTNNTELLIPQVVELNKTITNKY